MNADANKALNRRWIEAFNAKDWEAERACRADDYHAHMSGAPAALDSEGWAGFMAQFAAAFPDAQITVEAEVSEVDIVASRWRIEATHSGEFQGVPGTGRRVQVAGVDFSRVSDGKIAEHWAQFDVAGLMRQIT